MICLPPSRILYENDKWKGANLTEGTSSKKKFHNIRSRVIQKTLANVTILKSLMESASMQGLQRSMVSMHSAFYHANDEGGIAWNDPEIGVEWPIEEGMAILLSERDKKWGKLK